MADSRPDARRYRECSATCANDTRDGVTWQTSASDLTVDGGHATETLPVGSMRSILIARSTPSVGDASTPALWTVELGSTLPARGEPSARWASLGVSLKRTDQRHRPRSRRI